MVCYEFIGMSNRTLYGLRFASVANIEGVLVTKYRSKKTGAKAPVNINSGQVIKLQSVRTLHAGRHQTV